MNCPRKYTHHDISTHNCNKCNEGLLYASCCSGRDLRACAGWTDDEGCNSCEYYIEKYSQEALNE